MDIVYKSFLQPIWPDGVIRARWAVIRNTYPELQTTTIKSWHQWFPEEHGRWQKQGPPTHWLELETIRDGKPVPVEIDADQPALWRRQRLQGRTADAAGGAGDDDGLETHVGSPSWFTRPQSRRSRSTRAGGVA